MTTQPKNPWPPPPSNYLLDPRFSTRGSRPTFGLRVLTFGRQNHCKGIVIEVLRIPKPVIYSSIWVTKLCFILFKHVLRFANNKTLRSSVLNFYLGCDVKKSVKKNGTQIAIKLDRVRVQMHFNLSSYLANAKKDMKNCIIVFFIS